ncbi:MAG: hypothetical protein LBC85_05985 [Fibromonadaceae bacterium]|jgi:hypothetical protein|nr:hypothetical protein [Fibromonadaceae bacterium]
MKQNFFNRKFLVLILFVFISFSQAQLRNFLKSVLKSVGESVTKGICTEETLSKCNAEYRDFIDVNSTCDGFVRNDSEYHRCSEFVKNCECWTGQGNSQRDNEHRAYRFQSMKKAISEYESEMLERAKQDSIREKNCPKNLREECNRLLGHRSACDLDYDTAYRAHWGLQVKTNQTNTICRLRKISWRKNLYYYPWSTANCTQLSTALVRVIKNEISP